MSNASIAARLVYALAALVFGVIALVWHGFNIWQPADGVNDGTVREVLLYATAAAQIAGALAMQMPRIARAGTLAVLCVYTIFALFHVPAILAHPLVFATWGGLFEELALISAALILLERSDLQSVGIGLFGLCLWAFAAYQALYIPQTAALVPKWIPLGQTFWAIATTLAFGLAALAVTIRRADVLAARLSAAMFALFSALIWLPALAVHLQSHMLWAANAQNLGIAASALIIAGCLAQTSQAPEGAVRGRRRSSYRLSR